jgi:hypothetical protein
MGALTIAFDTTIVGALALPWVVLVIHLFFLEGESSIEVLFRWVRKQNQPAVASVLLFAMAYTLGSAVSRTAQDFFDDNDLHIELDGRLFRDGVTEKRILTSVYCDSNKTDLLQAGKESPVLTDKISTFQCVPGMKELCEQTLNWSVRLEDDPQDRDKQVRDRKERATQDHVLNDAAYDLFGLQENALMEKGGDYTVRLRQLHDQVMVLRGAAFNGVIGFSLCLFGLGAKFRRDHPGSWLRWVFLLVPILYLIVGVIAVSHHFLERVPSDPPYMEFTLLLLAGAGAWLLWRSPALRAANPGHQSHDPKENVGAKKPGAKPSWLEERWPPLVVVSAILTAAAILGWWSTEVLYAEQVVYSYDSLTSGAQGNDAK